MAASSRGSILSSSHRSSHLFLCLRRHMQCLERLLGNVYGGFEAEARSIDRRDQRGEKQTAGQRERQRKERGRDSKRERKYEKVPDRGTQRERENETIATVTNSFDEGHVMKSHSTVLGSHSNPIRSAVTVLLLIDGRRRGAQTDSRTQHFLLINSS